MNLFNLLLIANILVLGLASANLHFGRANYIVGGVQSSIEDNPWQVSLHYNSYHMCGGIIIGNSWVLTAAHCTKGMGISQLSVRVGSSYHGSGGSIIKLKNIVEHKDYVPYEYDYDFSLLELVEPLDFTDQIQSIALPDADTVVADKTTLLVSGWGNTKNPNESREKLRKADVPSVNQEVCKEVYSELNIEVTDRMICAGFKEGGKDSCQGDSGGPLSIQSDGGRVVIGVVSWGKGCAEASYPGVYGRVSSVRSWINDVTEI